MKITYEPDLLDFTLFVVGMIGVWSTTHNWYAVGWAWLAAVKITVKFNP